jgi:hypothetical protein
MTSSWRLRRVKAEDGHVDATGCTGLVYPKIVVFYILDPKNNLFF